MSDLVIAVVLAFLAACVYWAGNQQSDLPPRYAMFLVAFALLAMAVIVLLGGNPLGLFR